MARLQAACAAAAFTFAGASGAQEMERPRLQATRIDYADAPKIDGDLGDAAWTRAVANDSFRQVFPVENADPSERTVVRVLYDDHNLYVAVHSYDSEPNRIRANLLQRDPPIGNDDSVRVIIDPQLTGRDGYYFATNPNGAREDALLQNNGGFVGAWNGIWNARGRRTEDGWTAEFCIPFRTISFNPDSDEWGFQVVRVIPRKNESIRWSMVAQNRSRVDVGGIGRLTGIEAKSRGLGVDARGIFTSGWSRTEETGSEAFTGEPSGDVFIRLTPSLNGVITVNTDFSDTPLDSRRVNTGRFGLFFPETRSFFLEDTAIFEFGGRALGNPNGRPFFTRRIGLVDGQQVNLDYGAKLAGRAAAFDIGALITQTGATNIIIDDDTGEFREQDEQLLGAARIASRVLGDSKVGVIATFGDPTGLREASTLGADIQLRNNSIFGKGVLQFDAVYARTDNEQLDDNDLPTGERVADDFYGFELAYPNDRWSWELRAKEWGEDYEPVLGFVNRTGFREFGAEYRRRWRPNNKLLRAVNLGGWTTILQDLDDRPLEEFSGGFFELVSDAGDYAFVNGEYQRLKIEEEFDIADEALIPVRSYGWTDHVLEFGTTGNRRISVNGGMVCCEYFDGKRFNWWSGFRLRPNRFFEWRANYQQMFFDLPARTNADGDYFDGELHIHIGSTRLRMNASPRLSTDAEMQYDSVSEQVGILGRVRWEPRPRTEILLAVGHSASADPQIFPREFRAEGTSVILRVGNTFRL